MKKIKLTQGKVALVDDEDFDFLSRYKWHAHKGRSTFYAQRSVKNGSSCITIFMHRVIMETPDNLNTDHKDRDGLNNQKHNLRNCTHGQNQMNRKCSGKIKYLGVNKDRKYFQSRILVNKKRVFLGAFLNAKDAAIAYDKAALKYHGEFARLNFTL